MVWLACCLVQFVLYSRKKESRDTALAGDLVLLKVYLRDSEGYVETSAHAQAGQDLMAFMCKGWLAMYHIFQLRILVFVVESRFTWICG